MLADDEDGSCHHHLAVGLHGGPFEAERLLREEGAQVQYAAGTEFAGQAVPMSCKIPDC